MGFTPKILTSCVESVVSFWGKKIKIRQIINTKLKKHQYKYTLYFININNDNPQIHPQKISNKCYSVISTGIKRQNTISISPFNMPKNVKFERVSNYCRKGLLAE